MATSEISGMIKIAMIERIGSGFTFVRELTCSLDERWLASEWACVAPKKKYANEDFGMNFKNMKEEEVNNEK
jgi:hypothetical protein